MGRLSIRSLSAVEASVQNLQTDAHGADLAVDLLQKVITAPEITRLVANFWGQPCVGIKSLRAAVYALESTSLKTEKWTSDNWTSFVFYIRELVTQKRLLDHLNAHEWMVIWRTLARVTYDPQVYTLVCICWSILLQAKHLLPPELDECVANVCAVPHEAREQVYDGYLIHCLYYLHNLVPQTAIVARVLQLARRPRIKNLLFCQKLANIVQNMDEVSCEDADLIRGHLEPHTSIPVEDISFRSVDGGPGTRARPAFAPRPNVDLLPWDCCRALAQLEAATTDHQDKRRRKEVDAQLACFSRPNGEEPNVEPSAPSFWYFVHVALSAEKLESSAILDLLTVTISQYSHFPDSAPFALAQLLIELTSRNDFPGPVIRQINAFLSTPQWSYPLNSASIYLFRVMNSLGILDQQFQALLATKLAPWLRSSILTALTTQQMPVGLFSDLVGSPPFALDLSIEPTRGSFITFLGFALYLGQDVNVDPPAKLIKSDLLALIELHEILHPLNIAIPRALAAQLEPVVAATQADPELVWRAQFLLTSAQPSIEQFAYAQLPQTPTEKYFKEVVQGVFGNYQFNRDPLYLAQIIRLMALMDRSCAAYCEFYPFIFGLICEQSPFSPLRERIGQLVETARDWRKLFETSDSRIIMRLLNDLKVTYGPELLETRVPPLIASQFLVELAKRAEGADLGAIVAKLIPMDLEHITSIATHLGTTRDGLFRDIAPRVFQCWEHSPHEFPWHQLESSEQLRHCWPLATLPHEWFTKADKSLFASFYVAGLKDPAVATLVQSHYTDRQYETAIKRNFSQIQLKIWSTLALKRDPFWEGFPLPSLYDSWLDEVPQEYMLDTQSACWVMEQLILSVAQFRQEQLYCCLRQLWVVYKSQPVPGLISAHFVRCCIALVEQNLRELTPVLRLIYKEIAPHLESALVSEVLVQFPDLVEYATDIPVEHLDVTIKEICLGNVPPTQLWVQSFLDLEQQEFPVYFARFLCEKFPRGLEFSSDEREKLAPCLYRWTQVFGYHQDWWLTLVGRLVGEFPLASAEPKLVQSSDTTYQERLVEQLRNFCIDRGYLIRFAVAAYMRKLGPSATMGTGGASNMSSIKDLTTKSMHASDLAPTTKLLDPEVSATELSAQLFDHLSMLSLYRAFRLENELAPLLVPFQVAGACQDANIAADMRKIIKIQLQNSSVEVQRLVLKIVAEAYKSGGHVLSEFEPLVRKCIMLGQGSLGLMLVELWWSEGDSGGDNKPELAELLPQVLDMVDDPDIKFAKQVVPSLSTINLSAWDQLGYSLSSFNEQTSTGLRSVGAYQLANLIDKTSYFDFKSAWELEQWDLPISTATEPSRVELLFGLFKSWDFDQSYARGWSKNARDIFLLENETDAPRVCDDDHDMRLAREYYFARTKSSDKLIQDLSLNCSNFCLQGNKELAVTYAQKLSKITSSMLQNDHEARQMTQVQSARVAWLLGDQTTAISMLEQNLQTSRFISRASTLTLLAEWSAQAHHVSDTVLFSNYLEPAVKEALETTDLNVRAATYHTFARFSDEMFNNKQLATELQDARAMRDDQKRQVDKFKQQIRQNHGDKLAHSRLRKATQLYDIEQKEYANLKDRLRRYLDNAAKFYLLTLELGYSPLRDAGRFIALWYSHSDSGSLELIVAKYLQRVPSHIFIPWINQLTSRLDNKKTGFQAQLAALVVRLSKDHPYHTLWPILSVSLGSGMRATAGKSILKQTNPQKLEEFGQRMVTVANHKVKPEDKNNFSFGKIRGEKKWWTDIGNLELVSPIQRIPVNASCNYSNVPFISRIDQHIDIASGISAPKVIHYTASDGHVHSMLLKGGNDDLRQDAVMEQVFEHVNAFLQADTEACKRRLRARTYNVVPLGPKAGVIEFVQDTKALVSVLTPLHEKVDDREWGLLKARETMHRAFDYGKDARIAAYEEVCRHVRPCFGQFFLQEYRDAATWQQKRTNYSRSTALMSMIGYILGLGDRHCNNILLDVGSGEVVHIDLGIAFDQGRLLRIPETVPFRLTRDIVDALGVCGTHGVFARNAEHALALMRVQEDRIMTVLEVLRYDPLYSWSVSDSRKIHAQPGLTANSTPSSTDADQALLGVKRKLGDKLNAKATVRELVLQATSSRNLALIFEGWCPFY